MDKKLKNQERLDNGLPQIGRRIGTTRAKKPILKDDFYRLISFTTKTNHLQQQRARVKLKRAFTILYLTGCRISEIVDFTVSDLKKTIESKELLIKSTKTKTNQDRLISFSNKQIETLKTLLPQVPNSNFKLFDVTAGYLTIKCNDVIHKCLGSLYSTHSFRAGYITRLANNNENIELIRSDIGHKNISTTAIYIKVTEEEKREAKEKLDW
jgi:integrase